VLSLGGLLGEHLFSSAGLNPVAGTTTDSTVTAETLPTRVSSAQSVQASLGAFMGLTRLSARPAPPISLVDQDGRTTSVPAQPPSVVVLTFFNGECNDICPVVAAEIEKADIDLGPIAAHVEFLTINTNPRALAQSAQSAAVSGTGLGALPNWRMVTGPLQTMDSVWKAYGVSITVDERSGLEAHNDVMYFIDARGNLRFRATPFADESTTGTYSLPATTIVRWGQGIATYAGQLVTQ